MSKKDLIKLLQDCGAIQFGRFVLSSGAVSDYYIDIKKASTNPRILKRIVQEMSSYTKGYELLAGMVLGAVPLVVALSIETGLPYVILRKEKREHGTGKQIEGTDVQDKRVLIIEDVTTSGSSVIKSINVLRENKAIVDKVIVVVDRDGGARKKVQQLGLNFTPLLSVHDILKNRVN